MVFAQHFSGPHEVAAYAAGDLSPRRAAQLDAHLAKCPECRDLAADYRRRARRSASLAAAGLDPLPDTGSVALIGTRRKLVSNAVPVIGSLLTVLAFLAVLVAAWNAGGSDHRHNVAQPAQRFTQAGVALSDFDIAELRRSGWTCPDLRPEGLTMTSSTGTVHEGLARVTITYTGDGGAVVLSETRSVSDPASELPGPEAGDTAVHFRVGGADFALHSSLGTDRTSNLQASVTGIANDADQDAQAGQSGGWDRLSRGFARLVDPGR